MIFIPAKQCSGCVTHLSFSERLHPHPPSPQNLNKLQSTPHFQAHIRQIIRFITVGALRLRICVHSQSMLMITIF